MTSQQVVWKPNPGQQTKFLQSNVYEVCYGGAAGGGKSAASIALPLRFVHIPDYACLYLRRENKYLFDAIKKSDSLYPMFGAKRNKSSNLWTFPSGATVWLSHCKEESDTANYDSSEFNTIIFEELTHFTELQYLRIMARCRGAAQNVPRWIRSTTNPGGIGHDWVYERFRRWLDDEHPEYKPENDGQPFFELDEFGEQSPLGRTFIRATIDDNPFINKKEYEAILSKLDRVRRKQLRYGDFKIKVGKGELFKREWINDFVESSSPLRYDKIVRYWDLAAGGDYSSGTLESYKDPYYTIENVTRYKGTPAKTTELLFSVAKSDSTNVPIVIELDPGQASKYQQLSLATAKELQGFNLSFRSKRTNKEQAFSSLSSACENGIVKVRRGVWNNDFFAELEDFPEGNNDDQVDSSSGAHNWLAANINPNSNGNSLKTAIDILKTQRR